VGFVVVDELTNVVEGVVFEDVDEDLLVEVAPLF
jgi:hypothetical protein